MKFHLQVFFMYIFKSKSQDFGKARPSHDRLKFVDIVELRDITLGKEYQTVF